MNYLSDEAIQETLVAIEKTRRPDGSINTSQAAAMLGKTRSVIQHRVKALAKLGLLSDHSVIPGFEIDRVRTSYDKNGEIKGESVSQRPERPHYFEQPGFAIKATSTLRDADGNTVLQWTKADKAKPDPMEYVRAVEEAFKSFKPAAPMVPPVNHSYTDQLTLYPWADPHFGAYIWHGETDHNWDLDIAVKTFEEVFTKVIDRSPRSKKALLCVGGDTLHADDNTNQTPRSGHVVQTDGRHQKVFLTACMTIASIIDKLLHHHEEVEVIVLEGNHDETSASPIAYFLYAWFRNEPRVTIDTSVNKFRFRQFGKTMLGFTHGHTIRFDQMSSIMASYAPKIWGDTVFRFAHTFHVHHKKLHVAEGSSCITESHQVLVPADAWHYGAGYKSQRSLQSISYDKDRGETGRAREAIR